MLNYFYPKGFKDHIKIAKRGLDANWTGAYTKPSPALYPHQWNWDSGFIAIGYAHYNQKKAQQEILSLFRHQWTNGMVPQIVFNPMAMGHYFPEPDFWQVPGDRPTSGISMPPTHAIACGFRSCAPIRFYRAEAIEDQLDRAAKNFINSSEVILSLIHI